MLNNKGQSLVLFVLIIPILLLIMVLVVDIGRVFNTENKMDQVVTFVMEYYLTKQVNPLADTSKEQGKTEELAKENQTEQKEQLLPQDIEKLLGYNLKDAETKVQIQDGVISITSKTYVKGILTSIIDLDGFQISREYRGYLVGDKKKIEIK